MPDMETRNVCKRKGQVRSQQLTAVPGKGGAEAIQSGCVCLSIPQLLPHLWWRGPEWALPVALVMTCERTAQPLRASPSAQEQCLPLRAGCCASFARLALHFPQLLPPFISPVCLTSACPSALSCTHASCSHWELPRLS